MCWFGCLSHINNLDKYFLFHKIVFHPWDIDKRILQKKSQAMASIRIIQLRTIIKNTVFEYQ